MPFAATHARSLAACTHAHYMEGITSTTEIQTFVISHSDLKEIAQEQCVCRACELSIKRSMKKKDNSEVYKLRKTIAVFHLVPQCFLEKELIG